ncbi:hypothetical protein TNCV_3649941 [Trichonephila clavipes]|nr:hypothetical protein TNCV_3649941 [Trichonephila clavipes]
MYGCGAIYNICGKNSSCSWYHNDTTNCSKSVTSRTAPARRSVACIPLTPSHCRLRRRWCHARLFGRRRGGLLFFLIKAGSTLVPVMTMCGQKEAIGTTAIKLSAAYRHTGLTSRVISCYFSQ